MRLNFRSLSLLMIALSVFMAYGCNKVEEAVVFSVTLSESSVVFSSEGGAKSIDVLPFPENESWEVSCPDSKDWFTFEKGETSVIVKADPNYSSEPRSGIISITSPSKNFEAYEISVCQEAADVLDFSISAREHQFDSEGGQYTFTVKSNYSWTVETDADWLTVTSENDCVIVSADRNQTEDHKEGTVVVTAGQGELAESMEVGFSQGTRAENPYLNLIGKWEITSNTWYYSPNGSLNKLSYNPNQNDYYLIFDIEEREYGKTYMMRNFLYPDTALEIRYDKETGNIIIPFGWSVYSYSTFLYITLVGDRQFSYASLEVEGTPSEDYSSIALDIPSVEGFNHVGFGLWTYDENGNKIALGSNYRPTMFPMSPIVLRKYVTL